MRKLNENVEKKETLSKQMKINRSKEMDEEFESRLKKDCETGRTRLFEEIGEDRKRRQKKCKQMRRSKETYEERKRRLKKESERKRMKRLNETWEDRQKRLKILRNCYLKRKYWLEYHKKTAVVGFNEGIKLQHFCYNCSVQFLNNTFLLKHIIKHATLPSVILSRVDEHESDIHTIKKESENMEINKNICGDISQNVVYIKTECIEYSDNIEPELSNTFVNIKNEIEIDDVSFYTRIKKEMEQDLVNTLSDEPNC